MLGRQLGIHPQGLERTDGGRGRVPLDRERAEVVDAIRRAMLEPHLPGMVERHVDHRPLRGSEQHLVDERLALVATAVTTDQLDPRAGEGDVEDPRVRRVHEVEA
jgi:hypothetical protein